MKNKIIFLTLTLASLTALLCGCSLSGNTAKVQDNSLISDVSQNNNTPVAPTVQTNAGETINTIIIQGFAFNPAIININKGETVSWINRDTAPHAIKSATFMSNTLTTGQSYSYVFNETGTFDYSCSIHPSMKGQIIVQ